MTTLLTQREAAMALRLSERTLERMRVAELYLGPLPRLCDELRPLLEQRLSPQHEIAM